MFHRKPGQISPKSHPAQHKLQQTSNTTAPQVKETHPATLIQRAKADPSSLSSDEVLTLQSAIGNREVSRLLAGRSATKVQAKLTIGQPGDKYEQEADRVASQVVEQLHAPASAQLAQGQSVQRQDIEEEELQTKPSISDLQRSPLSPEVQREAMPDEDELQAKSILQPQEAIAVRDASTDLESAIQSARGSGQPLDAGLQQSMGQAMGADFRAVKVHTDAQSDQLNQSIQARAFTTGQDVFFRQGEYNPGSRGGQELIAHELTHVVQQNGGAVLRSPFPSTQLSQHLDTKSTVQLKPKNIDKTHTLNVDDQGVITNAEAERNQISVAYPLNLAITKGLLKSKDGEPIGGHLFKREYGGADDYSNVVTWSGKSEQSFTIFENKYLEKAIMDARGKGGVSRQVKTKATFSDFNVDLNNIRLPDKEASDGSVIKDRTIEKEKSTKNEAREAASLLKKFIKGAMESIPNFVQVSSRGVEAWERSGKNKIMNVNESIVEMQVANKFDYIMDGVGEEKAQITRAVEKLETMK
jgi:hypothetical protein